MTAIQPKAPSASPPHRDTPPSEGVMIALYRAALGPVSAPYYLAAFARFDTLGRSTPGWNWPASLCTLAWMVFRQLWGPALMYAAAIQGLAVMAFVLLRTLLDLPTAIEGGLLAALVLLSVAVPGLYGTAMVYADIRKRVDRALAATPTLHEAQTMLVQQASGYKRMSAIALVSALLAGAGALAYVMWPFHAVVLSPQALDTSTSPTVAQVQQARAQALPAEPANAPANASTSSAAPIEAAAPAVSKSVFTPSGPASEAAHVRQAAKASMPPSDTPTKTQAAPAPENTALAGKTATASASPKKPVTSTTASGQPTTPPANSKPMAANASEPVPASATPPLQDTTAELESAPNNSSDTPLEPVGQAPGYYINVGLFANEANARKAQARLLNEGIPAFRQTVDSAKGTRTRVRAGPYTTTAQANDAAQHIRSMGLEAQVFKR